MENYKLQVQSKVPHKIYAEYIESEALVQFQRCLAMKGCVQGALMPDSHTGYTAPIGSVLKFEGRISPQLVGYDIGCGMCAIRLDMKAGDLTVRQLNAITEKIVKSIPLGPNKHKSPVKIPTDVATMDMSEFAAQILIDTGRYQLGTLGGGNHFIEVGEDQDGYVNIVIHSGSRGVGYKIADYYMKEACIADVDEERYKKEFDENPKNIAWYVHSTKTGGLDKYIRAREEFVYRRTRARVKTNTEGHYSFCISDKRGKDYIKDMNMALEFALANRKAMIEKIVEAISKVIDQGPLLDYNNRFINRNHNHAVVSEDGTVIHRKGATHAEEGMMGVIPGNMKDGSFIVTGKGNTDSMCSSSHGAGRVLSRRKAKDQLSLEDFHKEMEGIVTNHTDATLDEAPKAYKDIYTVMEQQDDLVEIIDKVTPIINIKG